MTPTADFLIQAQHIRDLLERGQYAQARLVTFHLVCELRQEVLNEKPQDATPGA